MLIQEEETPEDMWCQDMEKDLSDKGVNIKAETLQRYSPFLLLLCCVSDSKFHC